MPRKTYTRNSEGLTDALFDAMELLRDGAIGPSEASAFAGLANAQLKVVEAEQRERALCIEESRQRALPAPSLPQD